MILRPHEVSPDAIVLTSREASRIFGHRLPGPAIFVIVVKNGEVLGGQRIGPEPVGEAEILARGAALVLDYEHDPSICVAHRSHAGSVRDGNEATYLLYHSWRQLFRPAR